MILIMLNSEPLENHQGGAPMFLPHRFYVPSSPVLSASGTPLTITKCSLGSKKGPKVPEFMQVQACFDTSINVNIRVVLDTKNTAPPTHHAQCLLRHYSEYLSRTPSGWHSQTSYLAPILVLTDCLALPTLLHVVLGIRGCQHVPLENARVRSRWWSCRLEP